MFGQINFFTPEDIYQARWMASNIYEEKLLMLSKQMLNYEEISNF